MSMPQSWKNLKFEAPAPNRVRVLGHLDDSWSDRLGGMVVTRAFTASLFGVLNALYELHLPILSVELIHDT